MTVARSTLDGWWAKAPFVWLLALASTLPLWGPTIPPLVDLPGHMARYYVELQHGRNPAVDYFYSFQWHWIGNLGVDLLIVPATALFGLELGVKLIVMAIPALTCLGLAWVSREVHGHIQPSLALALPLAYGYPFQFGFVNYALAMALTLIAFAFWLYLRRTRQNRLRLVLFLPIGCLLWLCHTFGWAMLCVLVFSSEWIRAHDRNHGPAQALVLAAIQCLVLAPPALLMLAWRSGDQVGGQTFDWFNWRMKWVWIKSALRDRWMGYDLASLAMLGAFVLLAAINRSLSFSRHLLITFTALVLVYGLLPRVVIGSAYADMRLVPYALAILLIAVRLTPRATHRFATGLAVAAIMFFGLRTIGTAYSFSLYDQAYQRELAALDHVPRNARLVTFVGAPCRPAWATHRMEHLAAFALFRRNAYTNDQWDVPGNQLLRAHLPNAGPFLSDPSQLVTKNRCRGERWLPFAEALHRAPQYNFTHIWVVAPPARVPVPATLQLLWRGGTSRVYRIHPPKPSPAASPVSPRD